ncbi:MAG: type II secretion system protein [Christensenellales bacterium]
MKREKGITLIALVITIVVLLILAGVSLSLVIGNDGILTRSKDTANKYGRQAENEQQGLNDVEMWLGQQFGENAGSGENTGVIKVPVNTKATSNGTINGKEPNINNPIIPKNYIPINSGNANWGDGNNSPAQGSVDNGLVIKDSDNNEWVWIPVEASTLSNMYVTSTKTDGEGFYGNSSVTTKIYTNTTTIGREGDTVTISRDTPGTTGWREPDLIVFDQREAYYKTILEFEDAQSTAEAFSRDYANMIASIQKYGGFYIGRYELSNEGVQKDKESLTNINWYYLYKKCKSLNASEKVESRMIYSIQWDLACDFISKKGEQKSITDSRSWGNYNDSISPANKGNYEKASNTASKKKNTGSNEAWKANNIYDLAGNCWELCQEAFMNGNRVGRGSTYSNSGLSGPVSSIGSYFAEQGVDIGGSRPTLIIE